MTKLDLIFNLIRENDTEFSHYFCQWIMENVHVYEAFTKVADMLRVNGREHTSARFIIQMLRHQTALRELPIFRVPLLPEEDTTDRKISNNPSPDMARLYMLMRPGLPEGFFTLGERKIKKRATDFFKKC